MEGVPEQPWPGPREVAQAISSSLDRIADQPTDGAAKARVLAQTLSETLNTVIIFAAPRLHQRWVGESPEDMRALRDACVALLDKFEAVAGGGVTGPPGMPFPVSVAPIRTLRDALARWDGTMPPAADVSATAEDLLSSFGVPEPPGGWVAFDFPTATRH